MAQVHAAFGGHARMADAMRAARGGNRVRLFEIGGRTDLFDQIQPVAQADHFEGSAVILRVRYPRGLDSVLHLRGRRRGFDHHTEGRALDTRVQNRGNVGQAVQRDLRRGLERPVFTELHPHDVTRGSVPAGGLAGLVAVDCNSAGIRSAAVQRRQHVEQHVSDRGIAVLRLIQKADYAAHESRLSAEPQPCIRWGQACALCMSICFGLSIPPPKAGASVRRSPVEAIAGS